ncbi:agmatine deiminase family protein [Thiospirillum jenense]|uniref:Agmatine deiminase family protein n=1 Tax=Thiospirillum jenense TaxID=1653858 RepID=A0A839HDY8_9GAMM|nr:agmatine deiminase family protein [Thiospirillum jenense]MBB1126704.1 agmatine deiminase family protein [Thiospirillum jenense]
MIRFPAEWEPQHTLLITWPHAATDWADQIVEVTALYVALTAAVSRYQSVLIVCRDDNHRRAIAHRLIDHQLGQAPIQLARAPYNDTWIRDYGPLTVLTTDGRVELRDFRFNGWGGKFAATLDDRLTNRLYQHGVFGGGALETSQLILEGGAIDTDGQGSVLLVRRTIIDPARNLNWSQTDIETELTRTLGVTRFHWLEHGWLSGDDTDGHIDTLARFTDSSTICHAWSDTPGDADAATLQQMTAELATLRQANGAPYRLIPLPQPAPIMTKDGRRLPATYVNFIILNGAVIVPIYNDPADEIACERLRSAFPGRMIQPLNARALIRQGGSLHCISMHTPAALPVRAIDLAAAVC